jgi:hypothetical protein
MASRASRFAVFLIFKPKLTHIFGRSTPKDASEIGNLPEALRPYRP